MERKKIEKSLTMPKNWKGDTLGFFISILSQNIKKLKEENFYIRKKNPTVPRKIEKGTLRDFPTWRKTAKKLKGDPLGEKVS